MELLFDAVVVLCLIFFGVFWMFFHEEGASAEERRNDRKAGLRFLFLALFIAFLAII